MSRRRFEDEATKSRFEAQVAEHLSRPRSPFDHSLGKAALAEKVGKYSRRRHPETERMGQDFANTLSYVNSVKKQ